MPQGRATHGSMDIGATIAAPMRGLRDTTHAPHALELFGLLRAGSPAEGDITCRGGTGDNAKFRDTLLSGAGQGFQTTDWRCV